MNETSKGVLRRGIDAFRTAPFGLSIMGGAIAPQAVLIAHENTEALAYTGPISGGIVAAASLLVAQQFGLKNRLEESIERTGPDNRILATTTDEWCARQTARVVCADLGILPEYEEMCARRRNGSAKMASPHLSRYLKTSN